MLSVLANRTYRHLFAAQVIALILLMFLLSGGSAIAAVIATYAAALDWIG